MPPSHLWVFLVFCFQTSALLCRSKIWIIEHKSFSIKHSIFFSLFLHLLLQEVRASLHCRLQTAEAQKIVLLSKNVVLDLSIWFFSYSAALVALIACELVLHLLLPDVSRRAFNPSYHRQPSLHTSCLKTFYLANCAHCFCTELCSLNTELCPLCSAFARNCVPLFAPPFSGSWVANSSASFCSVQRSPRC